MFPLAILIGGPTASGKSELAFKLQKKIPSIIINADSMQVYNKLHKLTNSPSNEEVKDFDCNLYNFIKYPLLCDLGIWLKEVKRILNKNSKKVPIFVGGTGLYLDGLNGQISPVPNIPKEIVESLEKTQKNKGNLYLHEELMRIDPDYAVKISKNDTQRIIRSLSVHSFTAKTFTYWHSIKTNKIFKRLIYIVISHQRNELYERINTRCSKIFNMECLDEIDSFLKNDMISNHPIHKAIGFQIFKSNIEGIINQDIALEKFQTETRNYAKRQITWFKNRSIGANFLPYNKAEDFILKNF